MSKLERITNVRLPFDRRHPDPSKNYGIHGLDIWFILKGEKGAVQFAVMLPVYLPHVEREKHTWGYKPEIMGIDVGYHAPTAQYEGQPSMKCETLGGECYYDGSSLRAQEWAETIFSTVGEPPEAVLWKMLEDEYESRFGNATSESAATAHNETCAKGGV